MTITPNYAKERLKQGKTSLGFQIRRLYGPDIVRIAKACDYDHLFIDMEHGAMDLETASQMCVSALDAGITPLVRVPGHEHFHAARILDNGAMGVIIPHVSTVEEAKRAVSQCKFPPVGHRSFGGPLPQLGFESLPVAEIGTISNENTLLIIMLETPEGIANADAIAALDGVDMLHVGCNDLAAEMGLHGQFGHPDVVAAVGKAIAAAQKHGKFAGLGGVGDEELTKKYVDMGMRFLSAGADFGFMMAGAKARSKFLRGLGHN